MIDFIYSLHLTFTITETFSGLKRRAPYPAGCRATCLYFVNNSEYRRGKFTNYVDEWI